MKELKIVIWERFKVTCIIPYFQDLLTLSHTTDFRLFQTENCRKVSTWVENTVGKGEITRYEQFLLFPQCFHTTCTADT